MVGNEGGVERGNGALVPPVRRYCWRCRRDECEHQCMRSAL